MEEAQIVADFGSGCAFDSEGINLEPEKIFNGVLNLMKRPGLGQFYLVFEKETQRPVATILTTYEMSPHFGGLIYWIQSVFVHAEFRGKGIFRFMYNHVIEQAKKDSRCKCVRLFVEKENERALRAYEGVGMTRLGDFDFYQKDPLSEAHHHH